ncbi:hypothetical protein RRG08_000092 [Elysia crispata]|uniref:Uncharacterized protein n=1 Tax=Elysia crispata TaxID=231223 RepID=A0AAE1A3K4_9GAST|nr:hypothetical protein RRG08_000092 [Elysia crispata]
MFGEHAVSARRIGTVKGKKKKDIGVTSPAQPRRELVRVERERSNGGQSSLNVVVIASTFGSSGVSICHWHRHKQLFPLGRPREKLVIVDD